MNRNQQIVRILFATGMLSVGALVLINGYVVLMFAATPPSWSWWIKPLGYACGILFSVAGLGLLSARTARVSTRILMPLLFLWTLSRVPVLAMDPGREITWFAVGEIAVPFAGALVLFVWFTDPKSQSKLDLFVAQNGLTAARILVGLSFVTYGLSHFFEFAAHTVSLVPSWLPFRTMWADVMGAAQIAAGLAALSRRYARWAVGAEAAMLTVFAILVWIPILIAKPSPGNWVELLFTWALAAACWVVAEGMPAPVTPGRSAS